MPVIANGGLDNTREAERIINDGHADLIALGTGAMANPDWPNRLKANDQIFDFDPDMFSFGVTVEDQFKWENKTKNMNR